MLYPCTPSTVNAASAVEAEPQGLSSLDPKPPNVERTRWDAIEQRARFLTSAGTRERWTSVLPRCGLGPKRLQAWGACGTQAWVLWSPSAKTLSVRCIRCRVRVCPACRHKARLALRDRLEHWLAGQTRTRHRMHRTERVFLHLIPSHQTSSAPDGTPSNSVLASLPPREPENDGQASFPGVDSAQNGSRRGEHVAHRRGFSGHPPQRPSRCGAFDAASASARHAVTRPASPSGTAWSTGLPSNRKPRSG